MISITYIWLIIALVCFVLELLTPTFSFLSVTFGALFAWLFSLFTDNLVIQLIVFLVAFAIFFIKLRPLIYKHSPKAKFNSDSLVGKVEFAATPITVESGTVRMDGTVWQARCIDEECTIEKGSKVVINKIDGNKLVVTKVVE